MLPQPPFDTLTQFAALGLTLVGGWLLGLASHPGGGRWRARYEDEALEHARARDLADETRRAQAQRIAELEAALERLDRGDAPPRNAAPERQEGPGMRAAGRAAVDGDAGAARDRRKPIRIRRAVRRWL